MFGLSKYVSDTNSVSKIVCLHFTEAVLQRCSYENVFLKYAANLQNNTHAKVQFQ